MFFAVLVRVQLKITENALIKLSRKGFITRYWRECGVSSRATLQAAPSPNNHTVSSENGKETAENNCRSQLPLPTPCHKMDASPLAFFPS